jgi:hypothetical protein
VGRKLDLLMGAFGGAAQAGASAYQGHLGRQAAAEETPYKREAWADMVAQRQAKLMAEQQKRETEMARTQAYQTDLETRKLRMEEEKRQSLLKQQAAKDYQEVFGPLFTGTDGSEMAGLSRLKTPEQIDAVMDRAGRKHTLINDPGVQHLMKLLEGRRRDLTLAGSRERVAGIGAGSRERVAQTRTLGGGGGGAMGGDLVAAVQQAQQDHDMARKAYDQLSSRASGQFPGMDLGLDRALAQAQAQLQAAVTRLMDAKRRLAQRSGKVEPLAPPPGPAVQQEPITSPEQWPPRRL